MKLIINFFISEISLSISAIARYAQFFYDHTESMTKRIISNGKSTCRACRDERDEIIKKKTQQYYVDLIKNVFTVFYLLYKFT